MRVCVAGAALPGSEAQMHLRAIQPEAAYVAFRNIPLSRESLKITPVSCSKITFLLTTLHLSYCTSRADPILSLPL